MKDIEKRALLLNLLVAESREIMNLIDKLKPCLELKRLHNNPVEKEDLEEIHDLLAVFLGAGVDLAEKAYAFRHRICEENLLDER